MTAFGVDSSNICSAIADGEDGPESCDYTDTDGVITAFTCVSSCEVPDCGGHVNPISLLTQGSLDSCSDGTFMTLMEAADDIDFVPDEVWEYLCGFGMDRRRLTTKSKGGAKHAPSPTLDLKLPAVQRAVAKAVAAARNLAK